MTNSQPPSRRIRAGDPERERVLKILEDAYSAGRLDADELRERQSRALEIKWVDECETLVDDLPEGHEIVATPQGAPAPKQRTGEMANPDGGNHIVILSGQNRELPWGTKRFASFAFWGGDDIDVTDAMGPGVRLELELNTVMGGNNIYVPEGVRVIDESIAILGGVDIKRDARGDGSNGTVVLRGFMMMGGGEVKLGREQQQ